MSSPVAIDVTAVWEPNTDGKPRWVCRVGDIIGSALLHPQLAASRLAYHLNIRRARVTFLGVSRPSPAAPFEHRFNIRGVQV